jgi:hypothetical protein
MSFSALLPEVFLSSYLSQPLPSLIGILLSESVMQVLCTARCRQPKEAPESTNLLDIYCPSAIPASLGCISKKWVSSLSLLRGSIGGGGEWEANNNSGPLLVKYNSNYPSKTALNSFEFSTVPIRAQREVAGSFYPTSVAKLLTI